MLEAKAATLHAAIAVIGMLVVAIGAAVAQTAPPAQSKTATEASKPGKAEPSKPSKAHDHELTANVRKAITADKSLSATAHNVKIMTINGSVTLRGPVAGKAEKEQLGALAKGVTGVTEVINNVDVPPPKPPKKKHSTATK